MSMSRRGRWLSLYSSIVKRMFLWRPFRRLKKLSSFFVPCCQMTNLPCFPLSFLPHTGPARGNFIMEYQMTIFTTSSFLFTFFLPFFTPCFTDFSLTCSLVLVFYLLPLSRVPSPLLHYSVQFLTDPHVVYLTYSSAGLRLHPSYWFVSYYLFSTRTDHLITGLISFRGSYNTQRNGKKAGEVATLCKCTCTTGSRYLPAFAPRKPLS